MMLIPDMTGGPAAPTADEAAGLPIRRATVDQIVAHRNRALTLYGEAHAAIANASAALEAAQEEALKASPGETRFNYHLKIEEAKFIASIKVPSPADFMASARKIVDTNVWSYVIRLTDLERLMDKKAKDDLYQQLITDVPEATTENICATLEKFMLDAGTIWKRGIAECFSNLDRRFRSHDGWKIGSRIILDHAFSADSGWWNWHRDQGATMLDVERVFRILDQGVGAALRGYGIQYLIDVERRQGYGPRQSTVESEYFRVRIYKNGNAHLWFLRDDLVDRVNQLLGEYYGAPIPEDREPDDDTGLFDPKTLPAKRYGFFPTPDDAADRVIRVVPLYREEEEPALTILEPSAGTGNLARRCASPMEGSEYRCGVHKYTYQATVDCVEIQPDLADSLRAEGTYRKVFGCNFLSLSPETTTGLYDRVVMNPPFDRERDIDHVMHALDFLKPDGCLVAIMSAGTEFRETRKSIAFRALMKSMNARFDDLPAGSFASVGTYCNTIVLKVWKNGRDQSWSSEVRRRFE